MIDYGNRDLFQRATFDDQVTDAIGKILRSAGRARDIGFVCKVADAVEYLGRLKRTVFTDPKVIARAAVDRCLERERAYEHETGAVRQ